MPTITLVQDAESDAHGIILMTAMPMNVDLENFAGGPSQFECTNDLKTIKAATSVKIAYDAAHGSRHGNIQVSSVIA